jgi:cellulose synthase/poly-beta-1,6-N-acetylglucosamine synthase-like glycosyltransferase
MLGFEFFHNLTFNIFILNQLRLFPDYFNHYLSKHHFVPATDTFPSSGLSVSIVIPCFNEPDILASLESLYSCERPGSSVEVIVVMNYPEGCEKEIVIQHENTVATLKTWIRERNDDHLTFHIIDAPALPRKFAGVGLARKIGMDEAVYRFSQVN